MRLVRLFNGRLFSKVPLYRFADAKPVIIPDVEQAIMNVLRQSPKCNTSKLTREATFEEIGFDSLDAVELIIAFEEELSFDIPDEEAMNSIKKVEDAVAIFSKYYTQKQKTPATE